MEQEQDIPEVKAKEVPLVFTRHFGFNPSSGKASGHVIRFTPGLSWIFGFCGPKGSGKTLSMTYFLAWLMVEGKRVFSNYPIRFNGIDRFGNIKEYASEQLSFEELYGLSENLSNCVVSIDELPLYAESRTSMKVANRVINYTLMMARHRGMSFFYTTQRFGWVDNRIQYSTDVRVECKDAAKLYGQHQGCKAGQVILLDLMDWSGQWTGRPFDEYPKVFSYRLKQADKYWGTYDSYYIIDPFEASRGVTILSDRFEVDTRRNGGNGANSILSQYQGRIVNCFSSLAGEGTTRVEANPLWDMIECEDDGMRKELGKWLNNSGVEKKRSTKGYSYDFTNFKGGEDD